jgi:hypothetical protein
MQTRLEVNLFSLVHHMLLPDTGTILAFQPRELALAAHDAPKDNIRSDTRQGKSAVVRLRASQPRSTLSQLQLMSRSMISLMAA